MLEKCRIRFNIRNLYGKAILWCAVLSFGCLMGASLVNPANAQLDESQVVVGETAEAAGLAQTTTDLPTIIGRLIYIALSTVGIIFLALLLYSGYQYMTAGGDPDKVKSAITRIRNAVIGLLLIAFSFIIVNFILGWLTGDSGIWGSVTGGGGQNGGLAQWGNSGGLGNGQILEYHYPEPGQMGVPRNTAIVITFVDKIDPASVINGWTAGNPTSGELNATNFLIHPEANNNQNLLPDQALAALSEDGHTVMIKPAELLGNSTKSTWYEVKLENDIMNASGTKIFQGNFSDGYAWSFEVSTQVDNTPPRVQSIIPISGGVYGRNIVVQINFNEPMFPGSVAGIYTGGGFQNLQIFQSDAGVNPTQIDGEFRLSNGYRTVEFITTDECGLNSCLVKMYCLPASKTINGVIKAASLLDNQSALAAGFETGIFNGAVDMAFNSLDGDADGLATGPLGDPAGGADDYPSINSPPFAFQTNAAIERDPPFIKMVDPDVLSDQIELDKNVDVYWLSDPNNMNGVILGYTVNSKSFRIYTEGPQEDDVDTWWFYSKMKNIDDNGQEATSTTSHAQSLVSIYHRPYQSSDIPKPGDPPGSTLNWYDPYVRHYVMNVYQNCYNPAARLDQGIKRMATPPNSNYCNNVEQGGEYCNFIKTP